MTRSKSPSTNTDGIRMVKETFKVMGNNKNFMKNRKSMNENRQIFENSFTNGSDVGMSMSMKKEYQNF